MYVLKINRPDYHRKDFMRMCHEIIEIIALDSDFKRIVDLASRYPYICAQVFEVVVEPNKTTHLDLCHNTVVFRFEDGWHYAYRRIKLMGSKDYGPPYLNQVWVSESYRHLLIEYQI